ncbi:uncharacterized protein FTJAE_9190 [Fusarium tjaetaba]|uniref:Uncharacterized protein n=1 Tax=Fusarium tjaetaba TaxID=1567544 RepID=A0A8H5R6W5_9HYPO|nr:uncharacterized protein FTJAE_9190 [Fusarium tjaetaba]KAF5627645.1 hypothetical protein FTJAE_9190 [Fusarium tjaetaba]
MLPQRASQQRSRVSTLVLRTSHETRHKVHRYHRWVTNNPELHQSYQDQARRDGYNPTGGSSNAFTGIYYPTPPLGGPSRQTQADSDLIFPHSPQHFRQATSNTSEPPSPGSEARPETIGAPTTQPAQLKWQIAWNAIGAAENALLLAELVKNFLDKGVTPELRQKATSILTTMGGTQGLTTGLNIIIGEQSPELAPSSIDPVLRTAHAGRSGSSSSTSKKFNDKPIPIDLTGSSSRKRWAADHESDEDVSGVLNAPTKPPTSALPVIPWQWQAAPSIIKDFIAFRNGCRAIYTLICADEAMSLPLTVAAYMAGIGKSLVMSLDMPLLIPYPDSTAMASYFTSISDMSIFSNVNDARVLARDTANFMKSQGWVDSAGLAIQHERAMTPAEGLSWQTS